MCKDPWIEIVCINLGNISVSLLNLRNRHLEWEGGKGPNPHRAPFTRFSV